MHFRSKELNEYQDDKIENYLFPYKQKMSGYLYIVATSFAVIYYIIAQWVAERSVNFFWDYSDVLKRLDIITHNQYNDIVYNASNNIIQSITAIDFFSFIFFLCIIYLFVVYQWLYFNSFLVFIKENSLGQLYTFFYALIVIGCVILIKENIYYWPIAFVFPIYFLRKKNQHLKKYLEENFHQVEFDKNTILNWAFFCESLKSPDDNAAKNRIKDFLYNENKLIQKGIEEWQNGEEIKEELREQIIKALNKIIERKDFYNQSDFQNIDMLEECSIYINRINNDSDKIQKLNKESLQDFNRLLIDSVYKGNIMISHHPLTKETDKWIRNLGVYFLSLILVISCIAVLLWVKLITYVDLLSIISSLGLFLLFYITILIYGRMPLSMCILSIVCVSLFSATGFAITENQFIKYFISIATVATYALTIFLTARRVTYGNLISASAEIKFPGIYIYEKKIREEMYEYICLKNQYLSLDSNKP